MAMPVSLRVPARHIQVWWVQSVTAGQLGSRRAGLRLCRVPENGRHALLPGDVILADGQDLTKHLLDRPGVLAHPHLLAF